MPEVNSLSRQRTFKIVGILLGGVWLTCLLGLTITTANPVTLNRQQVLVSDFVVQGQFDESKKSFNVEESFPIAIPQKKLTFVNRDELSFEPDEEYLVPVVVVDGRYHVTPSGMKELPLIYPVSPDAKQQLKKIMDEMSI